MAEEAVQEAQQEETSQATSEPKVEVVKEYIVDTTPIDESIKALKLAIESADESVLPTLEAQITALETQKKNAAAQADLAELAELRKSRFEQTLKQVLPEGIDPSAIPGNTNEERLAAAQAIAQAIAAKTQPKDEMQAKIEAEAKKIAEARWGGNLVPAGPGTEAGEDEVAELNKAVNEGGPEAVMNTPAFRKKYDSIPAGSLGPGRE